MNYAIIGCGMIAHVHARAIQSIPGEKLTCVFSAVSSQAEAFAQQYGCRAYATQEEVIEDPEVDAVCICTPSGYHADIAVQAMEHGKHVIVEKPMAISIPQSQRLIEAANQYQRKVCVISQRRMTPAIEFLKETIEHGDLGSLLFVELDMQYYRSEDYYRQGGWRGTWKLDGGGALMNQGIHGVDLMLHLCGDVERVFGIAKTRVHAIETEDTAGALVEFKNGAIGTIQATTSVPPGRPRTLEICGQRGVVKLEETNIVRWDMPGIPLPEEFTEHRQRENMESVSTVEDIDGHRQQYLDFIEAVQTGRLPNSNQYNGQKAIELICAIYRSSQEGKAVVLE